MSKKKNTETASPLATANALFSAPASVDLAKMKRRNMPAIIKPETVPIGGVVSGEIIGIIPSPTTTIKSPLLHLKHESGQEFTFPVTGCIRQAMVPGRSKEKDTDKSQAELIKALQPEVGKMFVATRLPDGVSKNYGNKKMYLFDVFTSDK